MRRTSLKVSIWVLAGAIVTCFWVLFAMVAGPGHFDGHWTVVAITVPASRLWQTKPVTWYTVMFLNAAIYGLLGLAIEPLLRFRRQLPLEPRPANSRLSS